MLDVPPIGNDEAGSSILPGFNIRILWPALILSAV